MPSPAPTVLPTTADPRDGVIVNFKRSTGYGFVRAPDGCMFFAHINDVVDPALREELNTLECNSSDENLHIPVRYRKGKTQGKKYDPAIDIRLLSPSRL
jgi:cold shock CspA family protein